MTTQMTRAEVDAFLASQRTVVLVTLRPNGSPVAHPMWFASLDDAVYVDTKRGSLKYRNVEHDARVCGVVEAGESYFELRGVRFEGRCEAVTDDALLRRVKEAQAEKEKRIGSGLGDLPDWFSKSRSDRLTRGSRVLLRIPMERVYSWDFSKIRDHYEGQRHE